MKVIKGVHIHQRRESLVNLLTKVSRWMLFEDIKRIISRAKKGAKLISTM